jgi:hypothetical protein
MHGHLSQHPIFLPMPKMADSARPRRVLDLPGGTGGRNPYHLRIVCPWQLDYDDQSVFLSALAMVAPDHRRLDVPGYHKVRLALKEDTDTGMLPTLAFKTTRHEIIRMLGWNRSAESYKRLEACLHRLESSTLHYRPTTGTAISSQLLACWRDRADDGSTGPLTVVFNVLSASVIRGDHQAGVVLHQMQDRRAIQTDKRTPKQVATAIYSVFVTLVKPGEEKILKLAAIMKKVLPGIDPSPDQKKDFRRAINHWPVPGWSLSITGRGKQTKVRVCRPKLPTF